MIFGLQTIILIVKICFSSENIENTPYTVQWSEFRRIPPEKTTIWPLFKSLSSSKDRFKPMKQRMRTTASVNTRNRGRDDEVNFRGPDIIVVIRAESKDDRDTMNLINNQKVNNEERMGTKDMRGLEKVMSTIELKSLGSGSLKPQRLPRKGSEGMSRLDPSGKGRMKLESSETETSRIVSMGPKGVGRIGLENNEKIGPQVIGKIGLDNLIGLGPNATEPEGVGENIGRIGPIGMGPKYVVGKVGPEDMERIVSNSIKIIGPKHVKTSTKPDGMNGMSLHEMGPKRINQASGSIREIKAGEIDSKGGIGGVAQESPFDAQKKESPKKILRERLVLRHQLKLPIEKDSKSEYTIETLQNVDSEYSETGSSEYMDRSHRRPKRSEKSKRRKHHKTRTSAHHKSLYKEIRRKIHKYDKYMQELDKEFSSKNREIEDPQRPKYRRHKHRKRHKGHNKRKSNKRKLHQSKLRKRKSDKRNRHKRNSLRRYYNGLNKFSEDSAENVSSESDDSE